MTLPVARIAAGVQAAAMVATPLARRGGPARRVLATVVVTSMAATTAGRAAARWGARRAAGAAVAVGGATAAVEAIGTRTGVPFGRYEYTGALRPHVAGVPVVVPLAWCAMSLPAREAAIAALGRHDTRLRRIVLGSAALTAWDLFLDPQMVGEGYWRWARGGAYRGIPLSNFAGWFVTGLGVMAALELLLPPADRPDPALVGEYGLMGAMETVGFAAFFRDRTVAAAGGAAMLPVALLGARHLLDWRQWRR